MGWHCFLKFARNLRDDKWQNEPMHKEKMELTVEELGKRSSKKISKMSKMMAENL